MLDITSRNYIEILQANDMNQVINELIESFSQVQDWEERFQLMIAMGKELPAMEEEYLIDKFKVKGCQSQVWLKTDLVDGKMLLQVDSDAMLVKGILAVLYKVYSGLTPVEVIAIKDDFLASMGIMEHLSMNRTNGLAAMLKQIKMYAIAYSAMAQ